MIIPTGTPPRAQADPTCLRRRPFAEIGRGDWERLYQATPAATPFSSWTFHRAWWDAYGVTAQEHYLVFSADPDPAVLAAGDEGGSIRAVVPLMTQQTPADPPPAATADGGDPGHRRLHESTRPALFFAASYHADYATVLAGRDDIPLVAGMMTRYALEQLRLGEVDRVDLRRLADADPLRACLVREVSHAASVAGLSSRVEAEDVCPAISLANEWHTQLAGMDKKTRHEIRRKLRRAEAHGPVSLRYLPLDAESADRFIHLHQARWGSDGLFADHEDGERSRTFLRRLAALEAEAADQARFHLGEVSIGDRIVYVLAGFSSRGTCYFYNAGMEPGSLELSPGVVGTAAYVRDRIGRGEECFDFLRGNEPYKYHWGAVDRTIHRIIIERPSPG
jgi:CelD/BcsL family acetyltransferase involved in cellulose biosynthesis